GLTTDSLHVLARFLGVRGLPLVVDGEDPPGPRLGALRPDVPLARQVEQPVGGADLRLPLAARPALVIVPGRQVHHRTSTYSARPTACVPRTVLPHLAQRNSGNFDWAVYAYPRRWNFVPLQLVQESGRSSL